VWNASYTYVSSGSGAEREKTEHQVIELRQLGRYVWGRNVTGSQHWYRLRGSLDQETYFTGLWESVSRGNIYHGVFQLVLDATGTSMGGKWLGFSNRREINHGEWGWKLVASHKVAKPPHRRMRGVTP
jgi:hypothetical protein